MCSRNLACDFFHERSFFLSSCNQNFASKLLFDSFAKRDEIFLRPALKTVFRSWVDCNPRTFETRLFDFMQEKREFFRFCFCSDLFCYFASAHNFMLVEVG